MRVLFCGTADLAAFILKKIIATPNLSVIGVISRPDQKAKRGQKLSPSAVKITAIQKEIPVITPTTLKNNSEVMQWIQNLYPEVIVVVAYGSLIPSEILIFPPHGCINMHASLLPRWRGASPMRQVILEGDDITGVTIIKMDEGLDTGDILEIESFPINSRDNHGHIHDKTMEVGAQCLLRILKRLCQNDSIEHIPQQHDLSTYAPKLLKEQQKINWFLSGIIITRLIRALDPQPGAWTLHGNMRIKLYDGQLSDDQSLPIDKPGCILKITPTHIHIGTSTNPIMISFIQKEGGKKLGIDAFCQGYPLKINDQLI